MWSWKRRQGAPSQQQQRPLYRSKSSERFSKHDEQRPPWRSKSAERFSKHDQQRPPWRSKSSERFSKHDEQRPPWRSKSAERFSNHDQQRPPWRSKSSERLSKHNEQRPQWRSKSSERFSKDNEQRPPWRSNSAERFSKHYEQRPPWRSNSFSKPNDRRSKSRDRFPHPKMNHHTRMQDMTTWHRQPWERSRSLNRGAHTRPHVHRNGRPLPEYMQHNFARFSNNQQGGGFHHSEIDTRMSRGRMSRMEDGAGAFTNARTRGRGRKDSVMLQRKPWKSSKSLEREDFRHEKLHRHGQPRHFKQFFAQSASGQTPSAPRKRKGVGFQHIANHKRKRCSIGEDMLHQDGAEMYYHSTNGRTRGHDRERSQSLHEAVKCLAHPCAVVCSTTLIRTIYFAIEACKQALSCRTNRKQFVCVLACDETTLHHIHEAISMYHYIVKQPHRNSASLTNSSIPVDVYTCFPDDFEWLVESKPPDFIDNMESVICADLDKIYSDSQPQSHHVHAYRNIWKHLISQGAKWRILSLVGPILPFTNAKTAVATLMSVLASVVRDLKSSRGNVHFWSSEKSLKTTILKPPDFHYQRLLVRYRSIFWAELGGLECEPVYEVFSNEMGFTCRLSFTTPLSIDGTSPNPCSTEVEARELAAIEILDALRKIERTHTDTSSVNKPCQFNLSRPVPQLLALPSTLAQTTHTFHVYNITHSNKHSPQLEHGCIGFPNPLSQEMSTDCCTHKFVFVDTISLDERQCEILIEFNKMLGALALEVDPSQVTYEEGSKYYFFLPYNPTTQTIDVDAIMSTVRPTDDQLLNQMVERLIFTPNSNGCANSDTILPCEDKLDEIRDRVLMPLHTHSLLALAVEGVRTDLNPQTPIHALTLNHGLSFGLLYGTSASIAAFYSLLPQPIALRPDQPLLCAEILSHKHSHKHNPTATSTLSPTLTLVVPEMCRALPLPTNFMKFVQAMPKIMHLTETYMRSEQFVRLLGLPIMQPMARLLDVALRVQQSESSRSKALQQLYRRVSVGRSNGKSKAKTRICKALCGNQAGNGAALLAVAGLHVLSMLVCACLFLQDPLATPSDLHNRKKSLLVQTNVHKAAMSSRLLSFLHDNANPNLWLFPGIPLGSFELKTSKHLVEVVHAVAGALYLGGKSFAHVTEFVAGLGIPTPTSKGLLESGLHSNELVSVPEYVPLREGLSSVFSHERECKYLSDVVQNIQLTLNYSFKFEHLCLQAVMHPSVFEKPNMSFERLETLGDTVLKVIVSDQMFDILRNTPGFDWSQVLPTEMQQLISWAGTNEAFAYFGVQVLKLHTFLIFRNAELQMQLMELAQNCAAFSLQKGKLMTYTDEFRIQSKPVADVFEALAGAVFLDAGYECTKNVFNKILGPYMRELVMSYLVNNPMKVLEKIFGDELKMTFHSFERRCQCRLSYRGHELVSSDEETGSAIARLVAADKLLTLKTQEELEALKLELNQTAPSYLHDDQTQPFVSSVPNFDSEPDHGWVTESSFVHSDDESEDDTGNIISDTQESDDRDW